MNKISLFSKSVFVLLSVLFQSTLASANNEEFLAQVSSGLVTLTSESDGTYDVEIVQISEVLESGVLFSAREIDKSLKKSILKGLLNPAGENENVQTSTQLLQALADSSVGTEYYERVQVPQFVEMHQAELKTGVHKIFKSIAHFLFQDDTEDEKYFRESFEDRKRNFFRDVCAEAADRGSISKKGFTECIQILSESRQFSLEMIAAEADLEVKEVESIPTKPLEDPAPLPQPVDQSLIQENSEEVLAVLRNQVAEATKRPVASLSSFSRERLEGILRHYRN
jgi:hypothetical protein